MDMMAKHKKYTLMTVVLLLICACGFYVYKNFMPGRVLNIYCWDNSFRELLAKHYPAYNPETEMIGNVKVRWVVVPYTNHVYQHTLDKALQMDNLNSNDNVDIFLTESDYIRKYAEAEDVSMALDKLGIEEKDLRDAFVYTRDLATDSNGRLRGVSWQAAPSVMIYRRDIAKRVLGSDEPAVVQKHVQTWEAFEKTAALMKQAGYHMLPGYMDTYRVYWAGVEKPWIAPEGYFVIDPHMEEWIRQTQRFEANGYNYPYGLWETNWNRQVRGDSFCYFGPAWLIKYALIPLSRDENLGGTDTYGKWGVCHGPEASFWGGTWIFAGSKTDNQELVADIMRTICLDKQVLTEMAKTDAEFVNDRQIMSRLAADKSYGMDFLAGQNPYGIMMDAAQSIHISQISSYDQGIHETFHNCFRIYFDGRLPREGAWQKFMANVWHIYPELQGAFFSYKTDGAEGEMDY